VRRLEEGVRCTWFVPTDTPLAARKQWIAGTLRPAGALSIDAGALQALAGGKSLLPAGVVRLAGRFDQGDTVSILAPDGTEVARGISAYSDIEVARIMGRKSAEIEGILGYRSGDVLVHRDDLVILRKDWQAQAAQEAS
jgi:glutamate 5-kinase